MKAKLILPALTEARGQYWRPIKYSLFPPLGLATLAAYFTDNDEVSIEDEHVAPIRLDDTPDLVGIETYITSAKRAYEIAARYRERGVFVVLGGLHVTSLPEEALQHADTVICGPAEEAWPRFLADFRCGQPQRIYRSMTRSLENVPVPRRDLISRRDYLAPNSIVVSRGCPHVCDFCYVRSFYQGGLSFYTTPVDRALAEMETLSGRHLFFLDDNILAQPSFAHSLFSGMRGMGRIWQAATTVASLRDRALLDAAVDSGLRSLFVGFETLNQEALRRHHKIQNRRSDYERVISELHARGVMINASFVFGMDQDDATVFDATVEWAVRNGLETATFHILTPYPGTPLFDAYQEEGRILHRDWNLYDTRHLVFRHPRMSSEQIESGYWRAYESFYGYRGILASALTKCSALATARHLAYATAWKKCDWFWAALIACKRLNLAVPALETVLRGYARRGAKFPVDSVADQAD